MPTLPLDKNGNPYTPMTEAEKRVHRNRPWDPAFGWVSSMLERWNKRQADEAAERERKAAQK